jgi:hypothetical protein
MQLDDAPAEGPPEALPLLVAAELQDHLLSATNDLERLQRLLEDASEALMTNFYGANQRIGELAAQADTLPAAQGAAVHEAMQNISRAVTALQFQDMAWQLINHTTRRLRACADQLAREAMGVDPEGEGVVEEAPLRPNPVTQDEMDAGSVELF